MDGGRRVRLILILGINSNCSTEIENLDRMKSRFPKTEQVFLEDNYRSTGAILTASIAIISEGAQSSLTEESICLTCFGRYNTTS